MKRELTIFKEGSTTFFMSSLFLPSKIRTDVFDFYSFVRVTDDYVDQVPADTHSFYELKRLWQTAVNDKKFNILKDPKDSTNLRVVKNMMRISKKYDLDQDWVDAFLNTMEADLAAENFKTEEDRLVYVYGSAEVIGLIMAKIMRLQPKAFMAAQMQGRAFQYINFIRDIEEDNYLSRQYFPYDNLNRFNLPDLTQQTATKQPEDFKKFIHFQIEDYRKCQDSALQGYKYIPRRYRIAIKTASDMYSWTAKQIYKNPAIIYQKKVKPSKFRVIRRIIVNTLAKH